MYYVNIMREKKVDCEVSWKTGFKNRFETYM